MAVHRIAITTSDTTGNVTGRIGRTNTQEELMALAREFESYASGARHASVGVSLAEASGVAASGTITMASGSGTVGAIIGGTTVTVTWGTSDTASSTALAAAINANSTVNKWVSATSSAGVTTITAIEKSALGNNVTLTATGTNVTASGSGKLTGGVAIAYTTYTRT